MKWLKTVRKSKAERDFASADEVLFSPLLSLWMLMLWTSYSDSLNPESYGRGLTIGFERVELGRSQKLSPQTWKDFIQGPSLT
jgi:hypothetical protein